jgi:hypothetical protein
LLTGRRQQLYHDNPEYFRQLNPLEVETSIDSLAPDSPILPVVLAARRAPWVRYHNIVGRKPKDSFLSKVAGDGDGVVSYASSHLADAQSEVAVSSDHLEIHRHPLAVLEVQRILREHLAEVDSQAPRRLERLPWTTSTTPNPAAPDPTRNTTPSAGDRTASAFPLP